MKIEVFYSKAILGIRTHIQLVSSEITRRVYSLYRAINTIFKAGACGFRSLASRLVQIKKSDSSSKVEKVQMKVLVSNPTRTEEIKQKPLDELKKTALIPSGSRNAQENSDDMAIIHAAQNGCLETVKGLIENKLISQNTYETAVFEAAQNGHLEISCLFLQNRKISEDAFGVAIFKAAEKGYLEILQAFLENSKEVFFQKDNLLQDYCSSAIFYLAGDPSKLDIIKLILKYCSISKDDKKKCMIQAKNGKATEIFEFLQLL